MTYSQNNKEATTVPRLGETAWTATGEYRVVAVMTNGTLIQLKPGKCCHGEGFATCPDKRHRAKRGKRRKPTEVRA